MQQPSLFLKTLHWVTSLPCLKSSGGFINRIHSILCPGLISSLNSDPCSLFDAFFSFLLPITHCAWATWRFFETYKLLPPLAFCDAVSLPLFFAELALSCHFPLYLDVTSSEKPSLTTAQKSHAFILRYICSPSTRHQRILLLACLFICPLILISELHKSQELCRVHQPASSACGLNSFRT